MKAYIHFLYKFRWVIVVLVSLLVMFLALIIDLVLLPALLSVMDKKQIYKQ